MLIVLALGSATAFACAGPEAGEAVFTDGQSTATKSTKKDGGKSDETPSTSTSSGAGGASTDAFFKTAFEFHPPGQKANAAAAHGGKPVEGDGTATTGPKDCVTAGCHLDGNTKWSAGGSVFAGAAGGKVPAGKYEIAIHKPDGTLFAATSPDEDGNFWFDAPGPIPDGSTVAIRKEGAASTAMSTKLTAANKGGGCNNATGCHGGASLRINAN